MRTKSKYFLGGTIIVGILALTLGMTNKPNDVKLNNAKSQQEVTGIEHDWPHYSTVKELVDASDLIVVGTVINDNKEVRNELKIIINENLPEETKAKYLKDKQYEILTESQIKISKVIKGNVKPDDVIKVQQTGGTYENVIQDVKDIKYLKIGNEIIIFLTKTDVNNIYVPINALQSHNYITNGKIKFNKDEVFIKDKSQDEISVFEIISDIEKNMK